jgi:hypothetical protein
VSGALKWRPRAGRWGVVTRLSGRLRALPEQLLDRCVTGARREVVGADRVRSRGRRRAPFFGTPAVRVRSGLPTRERSWTNTGIRVRVPSGGDARRRSLVQPRVRVVPSIASLTAIQTPVDGKSALAPSTFARRDWTQCPGHCAGAGAYSMSAVGTPS